MIFDKLPEVQSCCYLPLKWGVIFIAVYCMTVSLAQDRIARDSEHDPCFANLSHMKCFFTQIVYYVDYLKYFAVFMSFLPSALLIVGVLRRNRLIITVFLYCMSASITTSIIYHLIVISVVLSDQQCKSKQWSYFHCHILNYIAAIVEVYCMIVVKSFRSAIIMVGRRPALREEHDKIDDKNISKYGRRMVTRIDRTKTTKDKQKSDVDHSRTEAVEIKTKMKNKSSKRGADVISKTDDLTKNENSSSTTADEKNISAHKTITSTNINIPGTYSGRTDENNSNKHASKPVLKKRTRKNVTQLNKNLIHTKTVVSNPIIDINSDNSTTYENNTSTYESNSDTDINTIESTILDENKPITSANKSKTDKKQTNAGTKQ